MDVETFIDLLALILLITAIAILFAGVAVRKRWFAAGASQRVGCWKDGSILLRTGLACLVLAGVWWVYYTYFSWGYGKQIVTPESIERLATYHRIGYEQLGEYVGTTYPHAKAVIVTTINELPRNVQAGHTQQDITALTKGLGDRLTIVATHNFDAGTIQTWGPPKKLTVNDWDGLVAQYPDVDLFISFANIPKNLHQSQWWQRDAARRPKLVVAHNELYTEGYDMLAGPLAKGLIVAYLGRHTWHRDLLAQDLPADPQAAFAEYWVLVTPANLLASAKRYPELFFYDTRAHTPATP